MESCSYERMGGADRDGEGYMTYQAEWVLTVVAATLLAVLRHGGIQRWRGPRKGENRALFLGRHPHLRRALKQHFWLSLGGVALSLGLWLVLTLPVLPSRGPGARPWHMAFLVLGVLTFKDLATAYLEYRQGVTVWPRNHLFPPTFGFAACPRHLAFWRLGMAVVVLLLALGLIFALR